MNAIEIIFSPTGGTEKVAHIIASQWSEAPVKIDLSDPKADFSRCEIRKDDRVLIAMPSFGGRAPAVAIERLKRIAGNAARCTLVCVYGNRAYEDTLVEMADAANECGFRVVAAIAAVAEHSIIAQYAAGRPDATDEARLREFAGQIADKDTPLSSLPGNRPYKKSGAGLVPKVTKACTACGLCARSCPVQAIDTQTLAADPKRCIGCMRCVKLCPIGARKVNGIMVSAAALAIKKACSERKESELFL